MSDLKDDDERQPGSQDVPELQSELVRHRAPGRRSVVSVPALDGLVVGHQLEHGQAAVDVASQTPGGQRGSYHAGTRRSWIHFKTHTHVIFNAHSSLDTRW